MGTPPPGYFTTKVFETLSLGLGFCWRQIWFGWIYFGLFLFYAGGWGRCAKLHAHGGLAGEHTAGAKARDIGAMQARSNASREQCSKEQCKQGAMQAGSNASKEQRGQEQRRAGATGGR